MIVSKTAATPKVNKVINSNLRRLRILSRVSKFVDALYKEVMAATVKKVEAEGVAIWTSVDGTLSTDCVRKTTTLKPDAKVTDLIAEYVKGNLSVDEIEQLLTISVKGVQEVLSVETQKTMLDESKTVYAKFLPTAKDQLVLSESIVEGLAAIEAGLESKSL